MARRLTIKQREFVNHYIICRNATKAALLAGYSKKSAHVTGHENIKKPKIQAAIDERLREHRLTADEVLKRLSDHALGDIGDFLSDDGPFVDIDLRRAKKANKTHLIKKIKQTTKTTVLPDGSEIENHFLEIELHDPQKALDLLGKYYKLFTQRLEVETPWRDDVISLIRQDLVTFADVSDRFGKSLAQDLFESAGVSVE